MVVEDEAGRGCRGLEDYPRATRGVAGLGKDAERGEDIIVERHGRAVAAVISVDQFDELHRIREDLNAAGR